MYREDWPVRKRSQADLKRFLTQATRKMKMGFPKRVKTAGRAIGE